MPTSGYRWFTSATQNQSLPNYTIRGDHTIKEKNTISVSYFYRSQAPEMMQTSYAPDGIARTDTYKSQHYSFTDTLILRPTLVNELMFGYNRIWWERINSFGKSDWSVYGFPWPQTSPNQFIQINPNLSPSWFNINMANNKYEGRAVIDYRDTVSFNKGNHFMKGGAILQYQDTFAKLTYHMEYQYNGGWLGNLAAEYLIGWPNYMCCAAEDFYRPSRRKVPNFFFQDDWKLTPNLTVNLGIRYEPNYWAFIRNGAMLLFSPGATFTLYLNFPSGVFTPVDPASPNKAGRKNDLNNIAPRLGVAYRLTPSGNLVLRGGWGLFYDTTDANPDGVAQVAAFPFSHRWSTNFNLGYPGSEGWINIFAYQGIPMPDLTKKIDPKTAFFDENGLWHIFPRWKPRLCPSVEYNAGVSVPARLELYGLCRKPRG